MDSPSQAAPAFLDALRAELNPIDAWGAFRPGARAAAVAAVLYRRGGRWHLPFVRRRADLPDHPGQVALPGGVVKPGEDAWAAAAREVTEEIGLPREDLHPLGAGNPIYASVTNFSVVPFVCWVETPDPEFLADPGELDGVLQIPLDRMVLDEHWLAAAEPWMGRYFMWDGNAVWGLTERMLADLLPRFRGALGADSAEGPESPPPAAGGVGSLSTGPAGGA